jgi:hypothetical protein
MANKGRPQTRAQTLTLFILVGVAWLPLQALLLLVKPASGVGVGEIIYLSGYVKLAFFVQMIPAPLAELLPEGRSWVVDLLVVGVLAVLSVGAIGTCLGLIFWARNKAPTFRAALGSAIVGWLLADVLLTGTIFGLKALGVVSLD